jgi:hypothetical protein
MIGYLIAFLLLENRFLFFEYSWKETYMAFIKLVTISNLCHQQQNHMVW